MSTDLSRRFTEQEFDLLADFCDARVNAAVSARRDALRGTSQDEDTDVVLRALHALSITVTSLRTRSVLINDPHPTSEQARAAALDFAWNDLLNIARTWDDHRNFLPEFTEEPWENRPPLLSEEEEG